MPKLLLLLPQHPLDPSAGAPRSMLTIAEVLAAAGWEVRVLASTATESVVQDLRPRKHRDYYVAFHLLDTGTASVANWYSLYAVQFERMFAEELARKPDVMLTYGGSPRVHQQIRKAKEQGVKVVFGLRNPEYLEHISAIPVLTVDAILTPSRFLTDRYREVGIESTPLPLCLSLEDVVATSNTREFVTIINPSKEKGMDVFNEIVEITSQYDPSIKFLAVQSRGKLDGLIEYTNLTVWPIVHQPKEIYARTRILLAPSVWEEPAGRVAAEALVNGIPPLVSDQGGLEEVANGGGTVLPIDTPEMWVGTILALQKDDPYQRYCDRAIQAGRMYSDGTVDRRYVEFFGNLLA